MAYTYFIDSNSDDSHQTSPGYVLTFVRWSNRDTINYKSIDVLTTRQPLVVVNDAVNIQVSSQKNNPNHNFSCVLMQGDLNYMTAVHPGDYVIVNMVNYEEKAMEIRERALKGEAINKNDDGFKGIFKVADVRMQLSTSPNGTKQYFVTITARAFDEFNNILYFNPALDNKQNQSFIYNNFKSWREVILNKNQSNVQSLIREVIKRTIGTGLKITDNNDLKLNQVPTYQVPGIVLGLLNKTVDKDPYISKINNYYLGVWDSSASNTSKNSQIPLEKGFTNFFKKQRGSNWYQTNRKLSGTRQVMLQDFSNVSVWSLIQDYSNPVINEVYTCFRVADDKHVYPSFIARQKPFNTKHYKNNPNKIAHTQFLDIPRWKISPNLIYNINIGRSDAARINFVQIFTRNLASNESVNQTQQISMGNFVADDGDIKRNGRKPFVKNCNYDFPLDGTNQEQYLGLKYAHLVADWVMGGHLKLNGSISCVGIEEPICIGDNLEYDDVVYHIETLSHVMAIDANGIKTFQTNTSLSMGVDKKSTEKVPIYGEMDHTDSYTKRLEDYQREGVLPGFSESQDLPERSSGEELRETKQQSFTDPVSRKKTKK
jgi:hypothetical protein